MVGRTILEYLSYDVVTKTRVHRELPAEFPTITICNNSPFTSLFANDLLNQSYRDWCHLNGMHLNFSRIEHHLNAFQYETKHPIFSENKRIKLGPSLNSIIIKCKFAGKECDTETISGKKVFKDFSTYYSIIYGNCFRFNSGVDFFKNKTEIKKVYKEGRYSELELDLFIVDNHKIPDLNSNRGFRIFIENSSIVSSTYEGGINIRAGSMTESTIRKVITDRLPKPYSDCQKEYPLDDIYDSFRSAYVPYNERDCFNLCIQVLLHGCADHSRRSCGDFLGEECLLGGRSPGFRAVKSSHSTAAVGPLTVSRLSCAASPSGEGRQSAPRQRTSSRKVPLPSAGNTRSPSRHPDAAPDRSTRPTPS
jgi:hypothetical protein